MSVQTVRASLRAVAADAARDARAERQLRRFRPEVRNRVRGLAARHPWLADLASSFPALLFALALPRDHARAEAGVNAVIAGAPLTAAAAAAGVPLWLRAFPPEAFARRLPELPDSADFRRRIANHAPKNWRDAPDWLDRVALATRWVDDDVALWIAREAPQQRPRRRTRHYQAPPRERLVCLWAWYSQAPETEAGALIATRWNADMGWSAATAAADAWTSALSLAMWLKCANVDDAWAAPGLVDGYTFTPLLTAADIAEEADAMRNCVGTYGFDLAANYCRLWSVRRDGARVATLCLNVARGEAPYAHIGEMSGVSNAPVAAEVWLAARRWLQAQDTLHGDAARLQYRCAPPVDAKTWRALWRPYWLAKRRVPDWLPLTGDANSLYAI